MKRVLLSLLAGHLALTATALGQGGSQGDHPVFAGQKKIAIIMLSWSDRACPGTRQQVVDRMWNDPKSARNYFMDLSRGAFEFVLPPDANPDGSVPASTQWVYGPYELSVAAGYSEDITYANSDERLGGSYLYGAHHVARTLAYADGYHASNFDYIMYVTPKSDSTGGIRGYAGFEANYSHNFEVSNRTINHEFGHNLSLNHSNTALDVNNYSSHDCVMANSASPHVDGPHAYQLGWYPDSNFALTGFGQYEIENLAQPDSDALKVLRFDRGAAGATSNPGYNLWVEYRIKGVGHDDQLSGSWDRRVNIHLTQPSSRRPGDSLLNNLTNNLDQFPVRGSYTEPDGFCTVRFVRENTAGASAIVQLIDPTGNQPPSVTPNENYRVASGTTNFTLLATDPENDALTYMIVAPPATGTLTHSGSTFTYTGTTQGSFPFTVRVNDGQYDSFDETLTITVVGDGVPSVDAGPDQFVLSPSSLPWSPAAIPTRTWFDAADPDSITEAAGRVSQWMDKSGKGNHAVQPEDASRPAYDALNQRLTFDGNDIMQVTKDPYHGLQNFAVITLQKWNVSSSWKNTSVAYQGDSNSGWQLRQQGSFFDRLTFTRRGTSGSSDPTPTTTVNDSDFIGVGLRQNSKDTAIRHNGTETYSVSNDNGLIAYDGVNRSSLGGRYEGDDWSSPGNQLQGDLREIIVIEDASVDAVERAEGYLAHKWELTDNLPETHPYKTHPPTAPANAVRISGSASDPDGDELTYQWSVVSGPPGASFISPTSPTTFISFASHGSYVLRLTASDGPHSASDDLVVHFIRGDGPEISVSGNGQAIVSGVGSPGSTDGTEFGSVNAGSTVSRSFTLTNHGNSDLVLSGTPRVSIAGSPAFAVTTQPDSPIVTTTGASPSLGSSDFVITFSPAQAEPQYATVSIASNDGDEPLFTFIVAGNRPTVDVVASDALANEAGPDTGAWTFTRSGSGTASELIVPFTMSGTAIEGTDYSLSSSGQVVIPAGQSSATVTLTPLADLEIEGPETAVLTIADNGSFLMGTRQDTVIIDEPDQVLVTTPNGGGSYEILTTQTIGWTSLAGGNVRIDLLKGGVFHSEIAASVPNNGSYDWTLSGDLPAGGDYRVRISLLPDGTVADTSDADFTIILDPLAEAVDATQLAWNSTGQAEWFSQTTTTHDGVDAAQSGPITHGENSYLETTITGSGTLTFWWKVSSESTYDWLRFSLNGIEQTGSLTRISGEVDWVQKTVILPAGTHVVRWAYTKDGSVSHGADAAWLDQVVFTPDASTHTVSYDGNGSDAGSVPIDANTYSTGETVTVLGNPGSLSRSGYMFIAWNTAADGSGVSYSAADTLPISEDVTLYAQWEQTFAGWGGGVAFEDDANEDGVPNGLAWLLGAVNPNSNALPLLPIITIEPIGPVYHFTCRRSAYRNGATLKVQVSQDLGVVDSWANREVVVPDESALLGDLEFVVQPHSESAKFIDVQVSLRGFAGPRLFMRLEAAP